MFRKILRIQVCLLIFSANQTANGAGRDSTQLSSFQKILIVPYEPRMHLSDADQDISEYSEKTPQEIRSRLRLGITEKLNASLKSNYSTHSLMQDLRPDARQDMERIYGSVDYSYDTSFAILHPLPDSSVKGRWSENKLRKKEIEKRTALNDVRYMNVKILDPHLLSDLKAKYGTDLFVFLTQVEIKTHAKDCMDFQSQIYERDIKVHYAVYNIEGKEVYGDVADIHFPSNSNDIDEIMNKNFPSICNMICKSITATNLISYGITASTGNDH